MHFEREGEKGVEEKERTKRERERARERERERERNLERDATYIRRQPTGERNYPFRLYCCI